MIKKINNYFKLDTKNMIGYAKEIFTNDIVSILEKVIKK